MLQNGVAAENGTEDTAAAQADASSSAHSPVSSSVIALSLPATAHYLASIITHMDNILNMLSISGDHCATSCLQDTVENLPSAVLTNGGSDDDCSRVTPEMFRSQFAKQLVELKNRAESLNLGTTDTQWASDSDSKHGDSSSLLLEVNGNTGADEPQQRLIDAYHSSDEAASVPVNTCSQAANGGAEHVESELSSCAAVQPVRTSVASNVPEFISQGNSTPSNVRCY